MLLLRMSLRMLLVAMAGPVGMMKKGQLSPRRAR
jgi:hypothetical protein